MIWRGVPALGVQCVAERAKALPGNFDSTFPVALSSLSSVYGLRSTTPQSQLPSDELGVGSEG